MKMRRWDPHHPHPIPSPPSSFLTVAPSAMVTASSSSSPSSPRQGGGSSGRRRGSPRLRVSAVPLTQLLTPPTPSSSSRGLLFHRGSPPSSDQAITRDLLRRIIESNGNG
ncbi:hypothetical protein C8R45DRAFT_1109947 [Mycena sanguinolenta]|nr:hypothetical protein C8R45DRAFT_1109947 [Mycena sanguinolenta]